MNDNIAILLVGAPGSGKSTWGKHHAESRGFVRLCPDEFRALFGTGEDDQSVSARAFGATRGGMDNALAEGKSVLIDATNMSKKRRKEFLVIAKKHKVNTMAVVFEATKELLLTRNHTRGKLGGRNVPEFVIDRMLENYERPTKMEFDEVMFVTKVDVVNF
jgi:protein phosphatase